MYLKKLGSKDWLYQIDRFKEAAHKLCLLKRVERCEPRPDLRFPVVLGEVAVGVRDRHCVRVTKLLCNDVERDTLAHEVAGIRMSEAVEHELAGQSGL